MSAPPVIRPCQAIRPARERLRLRPHQPLSLRRAPAARTLALTSLVLTLAGGLGAPPARAYVRARTPDTLVPLYWTDPRKMLEVSRPPDGLGISNTDLRVSAQLAAAAWSHPALACTGISLTFSTTSTGSQVAGRDHRNRIIMRTGAWCRDPVGMTHCHDPAAVATTTIFSTARAGQVEDGEIMEADIEVNATGTFQWGVIPVGASGRDFENVYDLPSVLTHEMGHFLGLDHNCLTQDALPLIDDQGRQLPSCSSVPSDLQSFIEDATMYPFMTTFDVKLRTLTDDDARAACEMYPVGSPPLYQWTGGGGCAVAPPASSPSPARSLLMSGLAVAVVSLFLRRARRRRGIR